MRVCGIDPGSHGAMCVLDSTDPAYAEIFDLHERSAYEMGVWLNKQNVDRVCIEDVHSLYRMSAASNFSFGFALGMVHAIAGIVTRDKLTITVTPKVWQNAVGVSVKGAKFIKPQVAELVQSLYPSVNLYGKKGALKDGRSDAVMIAHYALHHHKDKEK